MRIGWFAGLQRFVCIHEGGASVGFYPLRVPKHRKKKGIEYETR